MPRVHRAVSYLVPTRAQPPSCLRNLRSHDPRFRGTVALADGVEASFFRPRGPSMLANPSTDERANHSAPGSNVVAFGPGHDLPPCSRQHPLPKMGVYVPLHSRSP